MNPLDLYLCLHTIFSVHNTASFWNIVKILQKVCSKNLQACGKKSTDSNTRLKERKIKCSIDNTVLFIIEGHRSENYSWFRVQGLGPRGPPISCRNIFCWTIESYQGVMPGVQPRTIAISNTLRIRFLLVILLQNFCKNYI